MPADGIHPDTLMSHQSFAVSLAHSCTCELVPTGAMRIASDVALPVFLSVMAMGVSPAVAASRAALLVALPFTPSLHNATALATTGSVTPDNSSTAAPFTVTDVLSVAKTVQLDWSVPSPKPSAVAATAKAVIVRGSPTNAAGMLSQMTSKTSVRSLSALTGGRAEPGGTRLLSQKPVAPAGTVYVTPSSVPLPFACSVMAAGSTGSNPIHASTRMLAPNPLMSPYVVVFLIFNNVFWLTV